MNQIRIGAALSYLGLFATIIVMLVYTPILIDQLGQAEYGVYTLIGAFVGYLTILDMGLGNAIVRYVARTRIANEKSEEAKLIGMFLILFSILGVIVTILGLVIYTQIDGLFGSQLSINELEIAKIMTIILIVNYAISFPLSVFGAVVQAHEKFIFLKFTNIIRTFITPFIIVPVLFLGYGSITVVLLTTAVNILFLVCNVIYAFLKLKVNVKFGAFDKPLLKEILIYSFFIFLTAIMDKIYWSTDQVILGAVSGVNQVAIYALAIQFISIYMVVATTISGLFLPKLSLMDINNATDKEFSDLFIRVGKIQAILIFYLIGGFFVLGKDFIYLWVGRDFSEAFYIVVILLIPLSIIWTQTLGIPILQAKNKHIFRSISYLIVSIINIIISIPIAKMYDGIGTAVVTAACMVLSHILLMNIYYWKVIKIDILKFWKNVSVDIFIVTVSFVFLSFLKSNVVLQISWYSLIFEGIIYSLVYFSLIYFLILNNVQRRTLKNLRNRRILK